MDLWHAIRVRISCQISAIASKLLKVIPRSLDSFERESPTDFSRVRKLPLGKLIVFILHLTASGKPGGVDIQAGLFFGAARREGLWPGAGAPSRSAVSRRRGKVDWSVFRGIFRKAVLLAYELWPNDRQYTWKGMNVLAIDGSKYRLPASRAVRVRFDPTSGPDNPRKGHYPQCLVSTLFDVLRRMPVARSVTGCHGSERNEALALLEEAPNNSLIIFDRGYPSYAMLRDLTGHDGLHFLMRCPAKQTFAPVIRFLRGGQPEAAIRIGPSKKEFQRTPREQRETLAYLTLRVIRMVSPDGVVSALLTDMNDTDAIDARELIELYRQRWAVETQYRDEKREMEIERFHGRTPNSIMQELYAIAIVTVIARLLSALVDDTANGAGTCQVKNACVTLAHGAALLTVRDPRTAARLLEDLLDLIARVRYYAPRRIRPNQPRINKSPPNKWIEGRAKRAGAD